LKAGVNKLSQCPLLTLFELFKHLIMKVGVAKIWNTHFSSSRLFLLYSPCTDPTQQNTGKAGVGDAERRCDLANSLLSTYVRLLNSHSVVHYQTC